MKNLFIVVLLIVSNFVSFGQNKQISISGTVVDEHNNPLIFASVYVKNTSYGTITNEEGEYTLLIPENCDSITASFVGYESKTRKYKKLKFNQIFKLKKNVITLSSVNIIQITAEEIIKKSIESINKNYPVKPVLLHFFYREKMYINDSLEYFAEAKQLIKKNYKNTQFDKHYIEKSRAYRFYKDTTLKIDLIGGIIPDILKNAKRNFGNKLLKHHELKLINILLLDGKRVYEISIKPKAKYKKTAIKGKLYIDANTYAFIIIDLKYINNKANKYKTNRRLYNAKYRLIGDKYYPVSFQLISEKYFKVNNIDYRANAHIVCTLTRIDSISDAKIKKLQYFERGTSLEYYPNNYDTSFWSNYTAILPDDEIKHELNSFIKKKSKINIKSFDVPVKCKKPNNYRELYHPHISLYLSSQSPNNLFAFNETYNSISALLNYYSLKIKQRNKYLGLLTPIFLMHVSIPFQSVEAERELLVKNNLFAKYNPLIYNKMGASYCYGLDNKEIISLKKDNNSDFLRFHNIRKDANYLSIKTIEENIALSDLKNKNNSFVFFKTYFMELFLRRFIYSVYYFPNYDLIDYKIKTDGRSEPIIYDRPKSFIKYLFNPTASFQRYISSSDLSNSEAKYLKRASYFSLLNLISPQAIAIKPFKLSKDMRFTFSLSYLLVPFGEMFEQNIWLYTKMNIFNISIKQYKNHKYLGGGIGLKFYNYKFSDKLSSHINIDYWYQPKNQVFYDKKFASGFGVKQIFEYKYYENIVNHNKDIILYFGYDIKTKGYQADNLSMNNNASLFCGFRYNFQR